MSVQTKKVLCFLPLFIFLLLIALFRVNFVKIGDKFYYVNSKNISIHYLEFDKNTNEVLDLDLSLLKRFSNLEYLYLGSQGNIDLSYLIEINTLKRLGVSQGATVQNWESLLKMNQLQYLYLKNAGLTNLDNFTELTNLTELYISYNPIIDISVVSNMPYLEVIDIYSTDIKDISPLLKSENLERVIVKRGQLSENNIALLRDKGIDVEVID